MPRTGVKAGRGVSHLLSRLNRMRRGSGSVQGRKTKTTRCLTTRAPHASLKSRAATPHLRHPARARRRADGGLCGPTPQVPDSRRWRGCSSSSNDASKEQRERRVSTRGTQFSASRHLVQHISTMQAVYCHTLSLHAWRPTVLTLRLRLCLVLLAAVGLSGCESSVVEPVADEAEVEIRFLHHLSVTEAVSGARDLGIQSLQLQGKFVIRGDSVTDLFTPRIGSSPTEIEAQWYAAQNQFLKDLLDLPSGELYSPYDLTESDLASGLQNGMPTVSALLGMSKISSAEVSARFGNNAVISASPNVAELLGIGPAPDPSTWVPAYGSVTTGASSSTERFVHNTMVFSETSGFGERATYEHDFFLNNHPGSELGPGTYLSSAELGGIATYRVPVTTYVASNLPAPYLDTRYTDSPSELAYTIGSAYARAIVKNHVYWTYIRTTNGSASQDNAKLMAQFGERRPDWCMTTWCSFGSPQNGLYRLVQGDWPIPVPGTTRWSTRAPVIAEVVPGTITGVPLPGRVTVRLSGSGFMDGASVQLSWTGGSRILDASFVTFINPGLFELRIATGTVADTWTVRVVNPDGRQSEPATFTVLPPRFAIGVSPSPSDGGSVSGGGSYSANSSATVNASPNTGYSFVRWTENGAQVSTSPSYTFTVTGNRTLVAVFNSVVSQTHTINVSASPTNAGSVSGGGTYSQNSSVTVTATAANGFTFSRWTENGSQVSTSTNYTFAATSSRNLQAVFNQNAQTYSVSVSASPSNGGSVSGGGSYSANSSATVNASPNTGHSFVRWTENGAQVSTSPSYTFTVTGNRTLVAVFEPTPTNQIEVVATGLNRPWAVATDGARVYWVENDVSQGVVRSAPVTGGAITTLATGVEPSAIALDESYVYWIERNNGSNGVLRRVPKAGGTPVTLASGLRNAQNFLAIDATSVYFGDGNPGGGGSIRKVGKSGGVVTTLVADNLNLTTAVATDGSFVYFHDDRGNIKRVPVNGGAAATIGGGSPSAMVVFGGMLYWVEYYGGTVKSMPSSGGVITTLASGSNGPAGIATDGSFVYWIEFSNSGGVKKVSVNGGQVVSISTQANTIGIALDSQHAYWAAGWHQRQIQRIKK